MNPRNPGVSRRTFCAATGGLLAAACTGAAPAEDESAWRAARQRGEIYAECGRAAVRLLHGWIEKKQDPETFLFSRGRKWDYHNEAADHYSSLVLIAHYVEPTLIEQDAPLHRTLLRCRELCSTPSGLPATYDLVSHRPGKPATLSQLAEWLRDGLIRLAEILGVNNDWYREMTRLVDAMISNSGGPAGLARAVTDLEGQGNLLQTLARLYAMSGEELYLSAAEAIADAILLGDRPPAVPSGFSDHGCEWVPGLGELFVLECKLGRAKAKQYGPPLRRLLDAILAASAHPVTGLFATNRRRGADVRWSRPPDTWGYVLFTYENFDRGTGDERYRAAVEKPLRWLIAQRNKFAELQNSLWPQAVSSDDWSDSYESMIVLWNRCPRIEGGFEWLDWATRQHVHRSHSNDPYGPYTGGHFDGSTGRTLCMHMMLCSQGARAVPFREDVRLGAVVQNATLKMTVGSDSPWQGRLCFDGPRCEYPGANMDWARINEMPQWFVVRPERKYQVTIGTAAAQTVNGAALLTGLNVDCPGAAGRTIRVTPVAEGK